MKTNVYLITYYNRSETFSGYAFVASPGAHFALKTLENLGRYALTLGYKVISLRDVGCFGCGEPGIIFEGVSPDGLSAYELAVRNGYTGTLEEWLASLKGERGIRGNRGTFIWKASIEPSANSYSISSLSTFYVPEENEDIVIPLKGDMIICSLNSYLYTITATNNTNVTVDTNYLNLKGLPFTYADFTLELLEGLKGLDGKSAYELAVENGYEGTEAEWIESINANGGTYQPSDDIPETATCTTIGNLKNQTAASLKGKTFNELFDTILFDDSPAYANYTNPSITSKGDVEVGTTIVESLFNFNVGSVSYGYPTGTASGTVSNKQIKKTTVSFGNNDSVITASFNTQIPNEKLPLTSKFGKPTTAILIIEKLEGITGNIKGYYNLGWGYNTTSFTSIKYTSYGSIDIPCTTESDKIYIAVPSTHIITGISIKNELTGNYDTMETSLYIESDLSRKETSLSTITYYYIYTISKSIPNADGSITPNSQPIKVTIGQR